MKYKPIYIGLLSYFTTHSNKTTAIHKLQLFSFLPTIFLFLIVFIDILQYTCVTLLHAFQHTYKRFK